MSKRIFVTAIDTNIGKTIVSAILCKALGADYWKPIQCGDLDNSDTLKVKRMTANYPGRIHPEAFALKHAVSPHSAAQKEGVDITLDEIHVPPTDNHLIIEGAGGVLVPINLKNTIADLIHHLDAQAVVVSKNYLGSINHTLLTIDLLKNRGIPVVGIIMTGAENPASEQAICSISGLPILGHVEWSNTLDAHFVSTEAERLKPELEKLVK